MNPSIFLAIVLSIFVSVSALFYLLGRLFLHPRRAPDDFDNTTALQGQLQQLFHLHDSGVDQALIDALPIFLYKSVAGLKHPFDCAICLSEFQADNKLRLLPKCSHAFHLDCIDTWLLSHSTCPLCRGSLLPDYSPTNPRSPVVLVLESGSESSREIGPDAAAAAAAAAPTAENAQLSFRREGEFGSCRTDAGGQKASEIAVKEEAAAGSELSEEKVVTVKLGKFRNVDVGDGGEGVGSSSRDYNADGRRCFSMGSFEYVMDDSSQLQVAIKPQPRKQGSKKPSLPLARQGHRHAMSECGGHSNRDGFKSFDATRGAEIHGGLDNASAGAEVGRKKRESFSVSKIWLRSKNEKQALGSEESSRRAFSFRLPMNRAAGGVETKGKADSSRAVSEIDVSEWGSRESELGFDSEVGSSISLESQGKTPSFARRTLLWLVGRQNKVVHSSSAPSQV